MGFEVTYLYHKKNEDGGGYDTEEVKETTKKIGDPFEDVPLEKLAASVLMQMARRDIWVVDVKITELRKKELAFKESNDGIIIKNKKFTLDSIAAALEAVEAQPQPQPQPHLRPQTQMPQLSDIGAPIAEAAPQSTMVQQSHGGEIPVPSELQGMVPQKVEVFDPEPDMLRAGMVKGKMTPGKKYPIFEERKDPRESTQGPLPILYVTIDDTGQRVVIPEPCFRPVQRGLIGGNFHTNPQQTAMRGDGLAWDGLVGGGVGPDPNANIDIRAGRRGIR